MRKQGRDLKKLQIIIDLLVAELRSPKRIEIMRSAIIGVGIVNATSSQIGC